MANSVYGTITLNYYESPDNPYIDLIRRTDIPFSYGKIHVERDSDGWTDEAYADANGYYSIDLPSTGSYSVTFEIENPRAYIDYNYSGSDISESEATETFSVSVNGATQRDYYWAWGDGGDLPSSSSTARALTAILSIGQMYDYVKNTRGYSGMDGENQRRIRILAQNEGSTTPSTEIINLGGPSGQSDEVAHHEYMHNVIYDLYGGHLISSSLGSDPLYDSQEAVAMDEGFSDYFTSARKGHQTYGGPAAEPAGTEPTFPYDDGVVIRYLWNDCTMNDFDGPWPCGSTSHSRSRIISGAVWRVRTIIGTAGDQLAFKALQIAPQPQSYVSYRNRLFAADDYYNNGANEATIEQKFADRFIGGPIEASRPVINVDQDGYPTVNWDDESAVEDGYRVERKLKSGSWNVVADLPAGTTSYKDDYQCTGFDSGKMYYRIEAYYENPGHPDETSLSSEWWMDLESCISPRISTPKAPPITDRLDTVPEETELSGAYPNPFNPQTTIQYALADDSFHRLVVYDLLGRQVSLLAEGFKKAGTYAVNFEASSLSSGVYVMRLETPHRQISRMVSLLK